MASIMYTSYNHDYYTLAIQMFGPNTADIKCITMIVHCASVTSIFPNRNVPDTYDCQCAQ